MELLHTHPLVVLQRASRPGAQLTYQGETHLGKRLVDRVTVPGPALAVDLYIARDDGEILAYRYPDSAGVALRVLSDHHDVGGLRIAYAQRLYHSTSQGSVIQKIVGITIDPDLPPGTFDAAKHTFPRFP